MKKTLLILALLLLVSGAAMGKTLQQDCTNTLRNLGACSQAQVGDPGALIFYWLPLARALEIRDAFLADKGYQAQIVCTNEPSNPIDIVRPWDASIAYVEQGHCTQAEAGALVDNPVGQNDWVDFQVRLFVRRVVRSQRINDVVNPVRNGEVLKPIEPFEENPDY